MVESKNKKDIYPERMVVFLDILGFQDLIVRANTESALIQKCSKAATLLTSITASKREANQHPTLRTLKKEITNFSDSIVISYLINCDDEESEYFGSTIF